ncbi:aldehyde dehydrogenase [Sphingobium sp. AS12]|uniref:aldehyde dehydrogenase n=1 Tax=Sphingobium sp. AS12 TaxID=2849495 RepID=UPI001C315E7D|nr:aldehyde dehydrogenase [Sphingobium sp. AS12]MBV2148109.1 aldehyde dehydrogenase [Sphingobium sp. AS12]
MIDQAFHPSLTHPDSLYIDGTWVRPETDAIFTVIAAHSGSAFARVAEAGPADIHRAIAAARQAFDKGPWPRMSHVERAAWLNLIAQKLTERAPALAAAQSNQMGILASLAAPGSYAGTMIFTNYAALAETYPFVEQHKTITGGAGLLVHEPVGVVAAIVPWNAPLSLMALKVAPALLAGCTMIVKASPEAPTEALILAEICDEIGLPAGVINVVTADRAVSELLVRHPDVDKVSFTGSSAAGRQIAAICGERIARCTLELGGKSAAVLLEDYDVEQAAQQLAAPLMYMNGQVCAALTRIVVPRRRQAVFTDAMAAAFAAIKVGDPFAEDSQLGPLATESQRHRVEGYIQRGQAEGATLAAGGKRPAQCNAGWFVEPTLFCDVNPNATIAQEEIFGPVAVIIPADDEDHAIAIANNSPFGLNSAVFTQDPQDAWRVGRQIRAGTVGHNGFKVDFNIAFGGFKQSGIGREGGAIGLRAYLEPKTMLIDAAEDWVPA